MLLLLVVTTTALAMLLYGGSLRAEPGRGRGEGHRPDPLRPPSGRVERLACRVVFAHAGTADDELALDCVVVDSPHLAAGTPFAMTVAAVGPTWLHDVVEDMVLRWAEHDEIVLLDVLHDPAGERVDARDNRARVRFDVRGRAPLG